MTTPDKHGALDARIQARWDVLRRDYGYPEALLCIICEELERAAANPVTAKEWQSIDVAPKDAESFQDFLLYDGEGCHVGRYVGWGPNRDWWNEDVCVRATHWMPLPEPPK